MNFEDIQKAWQEQQAPAGETGKTAGAVRSTVEEQVKALQRKVIFSNVGMSVALLFTCGFFALIWLKQPKNTFWFDVGIGLLLASMLLTAAVVWLRSVPWKHLKPDLSSREYISRALKSFRFRQVSLRVVMPVYMAALFLGINFLYLDIFWNAGLVQRLAVHGAGLLFMALVAGLSLYYSRRRYKEKFEPVIKELEELLQELESWK